MRLWSLPPSYLDSKGLVACWREGLLALNVLQEKTVGYKNHPQLNRFKKSKEPVLHICNYLHSICDEADRRGYEFKREKIPFEFTKMVRIPLNSGQLDYEFQLLRKKVLLRSPLEWKYGVCNVTNSYNDKVFSLVYGDVESWESVK